MKNQENGSDCASKTYACILAHCVYVCVSKLSRLINQKQQTDFWQILWHAAFTVAINWLKQLRPYANSIICQSEHNEDLLLSTLSNEIRFSVLGQAKQLAGQAGQAGRHADRHSN